MVRGGLVIALACGAGVGSAWAEDEPEVDPDDPALVIEAVAADCRAKATRLTELATECRSDMAQEPDQTCSVTVEVPTGQLIYTPAEADGFAARFTTQAEEVDKHVDPIRQAWRRVRMDQRAIRELGLEKRAEEFIMWEDLAKAEQDELEKKAVMFTIDGAIEVAKKGADVAVSKFTNSKTEKIVKLLKAAGLTDKDILARIRKLGGLKSRREIATIVKEILDKIGQFKSTIELTMSTHKGAWAEAACPAIGLLLEALSSKHAAAWNLMCSSGDLITEVAYAYYLRSVATERVAQLTEMTEQQLIALGKLHALMKTHVSELKRSIQSVKACNF